MAIDLLKNVITRIQQAAEYNSFPDWYIAELCTHDDNWSSDIIVNATDLDNPGTKKLQPFKMTRIWHRVPDNSWIFGGGWRHHQSVTPEMMESHAIEMSLKCWIMGIPHGGAKGGIAFDPQKYTQEDLIAIICKAVEKAIERNKIGPAVDRWAPDVNTNPTIMKWIQDHYSYQMRLRHTPQFAACVTGKPVNFGGMPGRVESTARGLHYAIQVFRRNGAITLPERPTVLLEGFGNVGSNFAALEEEFNVKVIGVLDQYGGVYHPNLPINQLMEYVARHPQKTVSGFHEICGGDAIKNAEELFSIKADIALPAALEETITEKIAKILNVKVLLEGANGPTVPEADPILHDRGIEVIPDIYANAGGVLVSYFEWEKDTHVMPFDILLEPPRIRNEELVFAALHDAFARNGAAIINLKKRLETGTGRSVSYRMASCIYAMERVLPTYAMKRKKNI